MEQRLKSIARESLAQLEIHPMVKNQSLSINDSLLHMQIGT